MEKICSDAKANRDAISLPPAPSVNAADATAAGPINSVTASVFPPSTSDLSPPMAVGLIDSTAAVPAVNPPSTADSRANTDSNVVTASSRPSTIAVSPSEYLPLSDSGHVNANSTTTTTPAPTSDSAINKEKKNLEFFGMAKEKYDVAKNNLLDNCGLTCISIGTAYSYMSTLIRRSYIMSTGMISRQW